MRRFSCACLGLVAFVALLCVVVWCYWSYRTTLPHVLWRFTTNARLPMVQTHGDKVYIGANGMLYALDHRSGKTLWSSAKLGDGYISEIFAASDSVIVGLCKYPKIEFQALDTNSGVRLWSTGGFVGHIESAIVPFVTARHVYAGDEQNNLVAVDRKTGVVKRSVSLGNRVLLYPLSSGELVFYVTRDSVLVAADDTTGDPVWTTFVEGAPITVDSSKSNRPIYKGYAQDSLLFVWDNSTLRAFDTQTGKQLWTSQYTPHYNSPLLYQYGTLYVIQESDKIIPIAPNVSTVKNQFTLYAINTTTGELRFQQTYDGWEGYPLTVVDDTLVVGGQWYIYGLNPLDGQILWRQSEGSSYYRETIIHKRIGYFAPRAGGGEFGLWMNKLKAIDLITGRELWSRSNHLTDRPYDYIYATDQVLIVQGNDGVITAIQLEN